MTINNGVHAVVLSAAKDLTGGRRPFSSAQILRSSRLPQDDGSGVGRHHMLILGIESTCDETGASIVEDGRIVRSNVVASQVDLHAKYRGVVPEIASRAHIENLLPVLKESLDQAGCGLADLNAIAVANRPGLIGSLLIGVTAAKSLAWSLSKPLIGVDHVHAHLYSVMLEEASDEAAKRRSDEGNEFKTSVASSLGRSVAFPAVGLVCSGGHTAL